VVTWPKWALAGAVVVVVVAAATLLAPSREDRIRRQFAVLVDNISKSPGQSRLVTAANAKRTRTVFTETITIDAPAYDYRRSLPAAEVPALVLAASAPYSELSLRFRDLSFEFPSQDQARVRATSRVRGRLPDGDWIEDVQELDCRFQLIDDSWRLAVVEVVEVLQK
jgi:hypothetical protein